MSNDYALEALEATREQIGSNVPHELLHQILEIEQRYAFDHDQASSALREIEQLVDASLAAGAQQ